MRRTLSLAYCCLFIFSACHQECQICWEGTDSTINSLSLLSSKSQEEDFPKPQLEYESPLSLAQLLDYALANNPLTRKAWWNSRRAAAAMGIAESIKYPFLDTYGEIRHAREVKFPNGHNTNFTLYSAELSLCYLLMDFGHSDAAIAAACWALSSADWQNDWAIQKVLYETTSAYFEYCSSKEILAARKAALKDAQASFDLAEQLKKAGLKSEVDLFSSQSVIARIKMEIAQQRAQVAIHKGRLAAVMGLTADTGFKVAPPPDELPVIATHSGLSALLQQADELRSDLLARRAEINQKSMEWTRSTKADLPKVRILGETGWRQYLKHEGNAYNYSIALTIDYPIFHGFEYTYNQRLAYANLALAEEDLRQLEIDIALEVLTYNQRFKAADEMLKQSTDYLRFAQKSYESGLEGYRAGTQSIFNLLDSANELSDARYRHAAVKYQWYVSLAQLAYATGTLDKCRW